MITADQAQKILKDNPAKGVEEMKKGINYYHNRTDITETGIDSVRIAREWNIKHGINPLHTADNRIPTNWHKIAVNQKVGYMFTYPPIVDADKTVTSILDAENYAKVIKQLAVDASNCGRGWLAYWYDRGKPFEFYFLDPLQITPIYDPQVIKPRLLYVIRRYSITENSKTVNMAEVWDAEGVVYFRGDQQAGASRHLYGRPPFIEFRNDNAASSDLDSYKVIIDTIDKLVSGLANDMDDIQELLFIIKSYQGESTEIDYVSGENGEVKEVPREINPILKAKMRKYFLVDGDGGVDVLRAEIPFEARKAYLDILVVIQCQIYEDLAAAFRVPLRYHPCQALA